MQIPLLLDRAEVRSLERQIVEQICEGIRVGRLRLGAKLPSSRDLSDQLQVSRNTVVRAYETLSSDGYIETRAGSGTFVTRQLPEQSMRAATAGCAMPDSNDMSLMPMPVLPTRAQQLVNRNRRHISIDFWPGRPDADLFPMKVWRRLAIEQFGKGRVGLTEYMDPAGLPALRAAIADHLSAARGIVAEADQIVIVCGIQEGINIASRMFLSQGAAALVEMPCYQGAAYTFASYGARVQPVRVDDAGLVVEELPDGGASLVYVTPSHQYPMGVTLTLERRQRLIAWARRTGCYILEDDYDSDFRYDGPPLHALAGLAPDCVIYMGTFSKSLGAGLRVGYMVLPRPIAAAARDVKALLNNGNPWLEQAVLTQFLQGGSYAAHLVRICQRYRRTRDKMVATLLDIFPGSSVSGQNGGLHIFWRLPASLPDADEIQSVARRVRVGIYSLPSGGAFIDEHHELARRAMIVGYPSLDPNEIGEGFRRVANALAGS